MNILQQEINSIWW